MNANEFVIWLKGFVVGSSPSDWDHYKLANLKQTLSSVTPVESEVKIVTVHTPVDYTKQYPVPYFIGPVTCTTGATKATTDKVEKKYGHKDPGYQ